MIRTKSKESLGPLDPKFERGIFLGYSEKNSTYLVGVWRTDSRCAVGHRFDCIESANVKFFGDVLV